jgi:hypothetical protein
MEEQRQQADVAHLAREEYTPIKRVMASHD